MMSIRRVACPVCGIKFQASALGSHCRSRTCQQNKLSHALIERGFVSAGTTWATLQKAGIKLERGSGNRWFGPEWAVRLAAALAPMTSIYEANERGTASPDYDALRRHRHLMLMRMASQHDQRLRDAIVSSWALGGNKAVANLALGITTEKGWTWPK